MKTTIKLVFIYFALQLLGMLLVLPFGALYCFLVDNTLDKASEVAMAPGMLMGFLLMGGYLWKQGYLTGDKRMYSPVSASYLGWSLVAGVSMIVLIDFVISHLAPLPDWLDNVFNLLPGRWLLILCIAVLGPVLEELLFRGAITKVLLQKYSPVKAILLSGLVFGIFHLNPAQIVGATLSGFLFAWIYYKTSSVIPGIVIHILNNTLSVCLSLNYPEAEYMTDLMSRQTYSIVLIFAIALFFLSLRMMNTYKLATTTASV